MHYTNTPRRLALITLASFALILPTASVFAAQSPTLSVSSSSGASGSAVTIRGAGFKPGEPVSIWFGGTRSTTTSSGSSYANSTGAFSIPMTVPWTASGNTTITAQGDSSGWVATTAFDIVSSTPVSQTPTGVVSVSPDNAAPGARVTVYGSAFPDNSKVTIYFGTAVAGTVTADYEGQFGSAITVPNLPEGLVIVTATNADPYNPFKFYVDASTGSGTPPPAAKAAVITVSPTSGGPGTDVIIHGTGFESGETVDVSFGTTVTAAVADANSDFSLTLSAPYPSVSENEKVTATGATSGRTASAMFSDVVPVVTQVTTSLTLSPTTGAPGSSVALTGSGFKADESIDLWFGPNESSTRADANGDFRISLAAPSVTSSEHVTASAAGQSSGKSASADFYDDVTPPTTSAPTNAELEAQIVALQKEVAALTALLDSWINTH